MFAPSERFVEIGYVEDKIVLPNSGSPFSQPVIVNRFFLWGIERSGFFNGREKWAKDFENQRV